MTREELIQSAAGLKQPSPEAVEEFGGKAEAMANILNEQFARRPDIAQLIGEGNLEMMHGNHRNHLRFMISLLGEYNPEVFAETVLWVFSAYRSHGFQLTYWPAQLDNWVEIFKNELSPESFGQIYPFYNWMIVNIPVFANINDQDI
jgi:hypothetical protein